MSRLRAGGPRTWLGWGWWRRDSFLCRLRLRLLRLLRLLRFLSLLRPLWQLLSYLRNLCIRSNLLCLRRGLLCFRWDPLYSRLGLAPRSGTRAFASGRLFVDERVGEVNRFLDYWSLDPRWNGRFRRCGYWPFSFLYSWGCWLVLVLVSTRRYVVYTRVKLRCWIRDRCGLFRFGVGSSWRLLLIAGGPAAIFFAGR